MYLLVLIIRFDLMTHGGGWQVRNAWQNHSACISTNMAPSTTVQATCQKQYSYSWLGHPQWNCLGSSDLTLIAASKAETELLTISSGHPCCSCRPYWDWQGSFITMVKKTSHFINTNGKGSGNWPEIDEHKAEYYYRCCLTIMAVLNINLLAVRFKLPQQFVQV